MARIDKQTAFLNILLGGTGREAGRHLSDLAVADQRPFPMIIVQIDTEPRTEPFVDRPILIPLDGGKIRTMKASPQTFGDVCTTIVENYGRFLNPEDIGNGARTIRLLTQLAFAYHYESILRGLRNAILDLYHQGGIGGIIPVLISSSGGGNRQRPANSLAPGPQRSVVREPPDRRSSRGCPANANSVPRGAVCLRASQSDDACR